MSITNVREMSPDEAMENASPRLREWVSDGPGRSLVGIVARIQIDVDVMRRIKALKAPQREAFIKWAELELAERMRDVV